MDNGQRVIVGIVAGFLALTVLTVGIVSCNSHPTPVVVTKNNYPQFMQTQPEDNYVYQAPSPVIVQQPYNSGVGDFTTGLVIGNMLSGPSYSRPYDYGYSGSRRSYSDNSVVNNHTTVIHQSAPVTNSSKSSSSSVSKSSSSGLSQRSVAPKSSSSSSSSGLSSRSVAPKSSAPTSKPASKPSTSSRSVAPRSSSKPSSSSKSSSSSSSRSSGGSRRPK